MGFLDFIKGIFREETKEETKQETASISELPDWINNKTKSISNQLQDKLNPIKDKIKQEIGLTKQNLKKLESAELRNPNITLKEKQFMKGNREAYIKRVNILVDRIDLPDNPEDILNSYKNFEKELQSFGKSTARPYHILQEFFGHESRDIALNIKTIDNHMKGLKQTIQDFGLDKTEKIKQDAEHLISAVKQKKDYASGIEQAQKALEDLRDSKNRTEKELDDFKKSGEFSAYEKLKEEKNKTMHDLEEHKKQLLHSFAVLERALKKFQRIAFEDDKLIESYVQNPVTSLEQDRELKIIDILDKLEDSVENSRLDLKDKKKDKTIEEIKKLNKDFFDNFLNKHNELKNKLSEINKQIESSKADDKIKELNEKLEKIKHSIETKSRNMDYTKKELEKIDVDKLKNEFKKEIKNAMNIELTLA
ncbi:hypothetical protein KY361_07200 [Candidatus Woesearchaeota archaeon]|nr:hypothetical protein [Candidatus Woesearchaeota archaeon]